MQQLVVFTIGGEAYGLPIEWVQEIIRAERPRTVPSSPPDVRGVINLRSKIIPVCDLAAALGIYGGDGEQSKIIVLNIGDAGIGVLVDDVDEVLTIDPALVEQPDVACNSPIVSGIAKIDERLLVLLDPSALVAARDFDAVLAA